MSKRLAVQVVTADVRGECAFIRSRACGGLSELRGLLKSFRRYDEFGAAVCFCLIGGAFPIILAGPWKTPLDSQQTTLVSNAEQGLFGRLGVKGSKQGSLGSSS